MRLLIANGGEAQLRIGFRDWVMAIGAIITTCGASLYGYTTLQQSRLDSVCERLLVTEVSVGAVQEHQKQLRCDVQKLGEELRAQLWSINQHLADQTVKVPTQ
jgi:hypothetical protein